MKISGIFSIPAKLNFYSKLYKVFFWGMLIFIFIFGAYLRIRLFLLNPGFHHDESMLALNMIERSYVDLFKPLDYLQVCPPFFLVISKIIYNLIKLKYTPEFSDMLLRFFPLLSSIAVIPLFSYLLYSIFKKGFECVAVIGAFILALNPFLIFYSAIFKQYSFETLIAIILMILVYNMNFSKENFKKNICLFILAGFFPLFSYSSCFILAGVYAYLIFMFIKEKNRDYLVYLTVMSVPLLLLSLFVFLPLFQTSFSGMQEYWNKEDSFGHNYSVFIKFIFFQLMQINIFLLGSKFYIVICFLVFSMLLMLIKNMKLFLLISFPFILLFFCIRFSLYPLAERLILFILPSVIILLFYPLSLFKKSTQLCVQVFLYILMFSFIVNHTKFFLHPPMNMYFLKKQYTTRSLFKEFYSNYDKKSTVIFAGANSFNYYNLFYNIKSPIEFHINAWKQDYNELPGGRYYILLDGNINSGNTFQTEIMNTIYKTAVVIDYKDYNNIINKKGNNKDTSDVPNVRYKNSEAGFAVASYVIFQK